MPQIEDPTWQLKQRREDELQQRAWMNAQRAKNGEAPMFEMPAGSGYAQPQQAPSMNLAALMQAINSSRPAAAAPAPAPAANPYRRKLDALLANPGAFDSSPVFKYAMDQGLESASRGLAARGMLNSGNRLLEMQKAGQGLATGQFYKLADLFGGLAGQKDSSTLAQNAQGLAAQNAADSSAQNWARLAQQQYQFDANRPNTQGGNSYRMNPVTFY